MGTKVTLKTRMTPKQRMKAIKPYRDKEITKVLLKHQDLRNLATQGWSSRSKPKFPRFIVNYKGGMRFGVKVNAKPAEQATLSVYRLVNDGTKIRRVALKAGYQNKTIPKRFGQFGKGGTIVRTKSGRPVAIFNFPGIKAREFDETANFVLEPEMTQGIIKGYRNGFNAS